MEAFNKKERQDETQFATKIDGFMSFSPPHPTLNVGVFLNLTLIMTKLKVLVLYFPLQIDTFSFNPWSDETELNRVHN
jgi:hypothetical protein